jgi:hypothetical protein
MCDTAVGVRTQNPSYTPCTTSIKAPTVADEHVAQRVVEHVRHGVVGGHEGAPVVVHVHAHRVAHLQKRNAHTRTMSATSYWFNAHMRHSQPLIDVRTATQLSYKSILTQSGER